jgi:succinate-semialdehyde dehydrogenase/glutarate-semialdehyde dehydrogenase
MTHPMTELARIGLKRPDLFEQRAWIGGQWVSADKTLTVTNPATGGQIGTIPNLGSDEAQAAVTAAVEALLDWRARSGKERAIILRRWFDLMNQHTEDLARLMTAEQGKPLAESRGEIAYAASFVEWFAEEAKRTNGEILSAPARDRRLVVLRQPVGVVAAVTPWNFPAAMITRKAAPAFAAGCTMVLKPSELTPYSALAMAVLAHEAGLPPGVFNVITGDAPPIGAVLTGDPRVRKFTFTGSTAVGKALAAQCMATVKRVSLELGGNAPFIVMDDANIDSAVEGALLSKFRNTGQTCVCANRIFVQAGVYDRFAEKFTARVKAFKVGDGLSGPTDQGPLIDDRAVKKVEHHVNDALAKGARLLSGGKRHELGGTFFEPTVLADVTPDMVISQEETFGPVAGLFRFDTLAEVIAMANDTAAGLAAYVYTNDTNRSWALGEGLEYGMVGVNTGIIASEVIPFGGVKESGIGREGSHLGIDEFLEYKTLCLAVGKPA